MSTLDYLADLPVVADPPELSEDLVAPIPYFGGKRRAAALIWERLGDVTNYGEPFFGSGAVLLARPAWHRARVETVNDIDGLVVNFWRAVQADPDGVAAGCDWPVMELDLHARHRALIAARPALAERLEADPRYYDVELAGWWAWGASCWIGAGWCDDTHRNARGHQRPDLSGGEGSPKAGTGVHAAAQREPSRKMPILIGGHGDVNSPQLGKGVHSGEMRGPASRLPDLGGGAVWGNADAAHPRPGKGVHAGGMRRQLPDVGGSASPSRGETYANHGKGVHGARARTALYDTFERLARRLRYVRFTCGDFLRICSPAVTWRHGLTGVLLDPPYGDQKRTSRIYARDSMTVAAAARAWALEAGQRDDMRIALCGYEGEHDELLAHGWSVVSWKAHGGYGVQGDGAGRENAERERIWFSPHCLPSGAAEPAPTTEQLALW